MLKIVCLLIGVSQANIFDNRIITKVRHGIEKSLNYLEENYDKINADCLLGVVFTAALIKDVYYNGTHIMDSSSLKIIHKATEVFQKSKSFISPEDQWIVQYFFTDNIWDKNITYNNTLRYFNINTSPLKTMENIKILHTATNRLNITLPNVDYCFKELGNATADLKPRKYSLPDYCFNYFYNNNYWNFGYFLTHKLLLLQYAKARHYHFKENYYENETNKLCSLIFAEISALEYHDQLDNTFDLFLEQVLLCGYEGYIEFFEYKWLYYILKTQRISGCYPAFLTDDLKTRLKRDLQILDDGCADHTTGLGLATLALHYNYIIKETLVVKK